jgi:hypothetical protein
VLRPGARVNVILDPAVRLDFPTKMAIGFMSAPVKSMGCRLIPREIALYLDRHTWKFSLTRAGRLAYRSP